LRCEAAHTAPEEPNVYGNKQESMRAPKERHQSTKSDIAPPELVSPLLFVTINIGLLRSKKRMLKLQSGDVANGYYIVAFGDKNGIHKENEDAIRHKNHWQ
jgi:hypothetical protein